jgi:hypothetical protein
LRRAQVLSDRIVWVRRSRQAASHKLVEFTIESGCNHAAAISLHMMYYNFARVHMALKTMVPAMAAGVANHVWSIEEIVNLLDSN